MLLGVADGASSDADGSAVRLADSLLTIGAAQGPPGRLRRYVLLSDVMFVSAPLHAAEVRRSKPYYVLVVIQRHTAHI
jgi:hypothetical protein